MNEIEKVFFGTLVEVTHLDGSKWEGWRGEVSGAGLVFLVKQLFVQEANHYVRIYLEDELRRVTSSLGNIIQDDGETLKLQTIRSIYHISYKHHLTAKEMRKIASELGLPINMLNVGQEDTR